MNTPEDNTETNTETHTESTVESAPLEQGRPLGYWLRAVDSLISAAFAEALENEGVSRREWMILNALSGDVQAPGLAERLARKGKTLRRLESRGWVVEGGDGTWGLTDSGRAARAQLADTVGGIRSRVARAVSPEDYATMIASLEAIATELGGAETVGPAFGQPGRRGPRGFGRGERGRRHGHGHGHGERGHRHEHGKREHGDGHGDCERGHGERRDQRGGPRHTHGRHMDIHIHMHPGAGAPQR